MGWDVGVVQEQWPKMNEGQDCPKPELAMPLESNRYGTDTLPYIFVAWAGPEGEREKERERERAKQKDEHACPRRRRQWLDGLVPSVAILPKSSNCQSSGFFQAVPKTLKIHE